MQGYLRDLETAVWAKYNYGNIVASPNTIRAAFELAYMGYGYNLDILENLGYEDIHYFVNGEEKPSRDKNSYVSQLIRYAKDGSSLNMLVCVKKQSKYVVCISIAGSGADINDWKDNFHFEQEDGMHEGFYKNASELLEIIRNIKLDSLAKEFGVKSFGISDILDECAMPRSRFKFFITGHSKGAGIAQLLNHILIDNLYISRENILSVLFASPSVVSGKYLQTPFKYPIINIQNADDLVTKFGSIAQLGVCMEFRLPDKHYGFETTAHKLLLNTIRTIRSGYNWPIIMYALFNHLIELDDDAPTDPSMIKYFIPKRLLKNYVSLIPKYFESMAGTTFDMEASLNIQKKIAEVCHEYKLTELLKLIIAFVNKTHKLYEPDSPYRHFAENPTGYKLYIYDRELKKRNAGRVVRLVDRPNSPLRTDKNKTRRIIQRKL